MTVIRALEVASWILAMGALASIMGCVAIALLVDHVSRD